MPIHPTSIVPDPNNQGVEHNGTLYSFFTLKFPRPLTPEEINEFISKNNLAGALVKHNPEKLSQFVLAVPIITTKDLTQDPLTITRKAEGAYDKLQTLFLQTLFGPRNTQARQELSNARNAEKEAETTFQIAVDTLTERSKYTKEKPFDDISPEQREALERYHEASEALEDVLGNDEDDKESKYARRSAEAELQQAQEQLSVFQDIKPAATLVSDTKRKLATLQQEVNEINAAFSEFKAAEREFFTQIYDKNLLPHFDGGGSYPHQQYGTFDPTDDYLNGFDASYSHDEREENHKPSINPTPEQKPKDPTIPSTLMRSASFEKGPATEIDGGRGGH